MATFQNDNLASFHIFVGEQLQSGAATLSPEQVLAMWRERMDTIASVSRGIADIDAGRTRSADEVLEELRRELQDE